MWKIKVFHTLQFFHWICVSDDVMNSRIPWFIFCQVKMKSNDLKISKSISGWELFWRSLHSAGATGTCAATRVNSFWPRQCRACPQANSLLSCGAQTHAFAQKTFWSDIALCSVLSTSESAERPGVQKTSWGCDFNPLAIVSTLHVFPECLSKSWNIRSSHRGSSVNEPN